MDPSPIAQRVWDMKYRLRAPDGSPVDKTVHDSWERVATALSAVETDPSMWQPKFLEALEDFRFLPAGRILAGTGTDRNVTLFNCFVMGEIPDDMAGIFQHLKEAALTMQQGGGIGYDFSTLRPRGAMVAGVGADASGPVSFMEVWDAMCRTIMSAGSRRGAMMATLRCDHPDIEEFISAKQTPGHLTNFNLSVLVTDAFMEAVASGADWPLSFGGKTIRTVKAAALWDRIMRATYGYSEPGVIFIDRINRRNNLSYCETISATNPCGEQPLPPYGACLLGSINLTRLVQDPFGKDAALDLPALDALVTTAIRMMDNVVDVSAFPLDAQRQEAQAKRRIGLGVTGLADALIMCGVSYGSQESLELVGRWLHRLQRAAYLASVALAKEKGPFPLYDAEAYLAGETIAGLDPDIREAIAAHGIRNALVTSIAPTGTISLIADNVSSGIEPVFAFRHTRKVLLPDGGQTQEEVADYAYRLYRQMFGEEAALPDHFLDAQTLPPAAHVTMQATAQRYVDSSISKTINVPEETDFDSFKDLYAQAYAQGCKGCTTYRPSPVRGAVLAPADETAKPAAAPAETEGPGEIVYMAQPLQRPPGLEGRTYKLRWPDSDHAIYITVNDIEEGGRRRPFEVFINSKNMEHYAWTVALTRMISAVFRRGGDVAFVVEELKAVFDPRGGCWMEGRYIPSLLAAIGGVIEQHMVNIGFLPKPAADDRDRRIIARAVGDEDIGRQCPKCGLPGTVSQEGCETCLSCGWSKCT